MAQMKYDGDEKFSKYGSKSPAISLAARFATLASLVISVVVLKTNNLQVTDDYQTVNSYKSFRSYNYMFYVIIIGVIYTVVQIPFEAYYMMTKQHLINNTLFLKLDFVADMVILFFLATAAGAGFGMTLDSKKYNWQGAQEEMEGYFDRNLIPDSFLLLGSLFSAVSVFYSAMALSRN